MTGMLARFDRPLVFLREDRGGPPKARVDRVLSYLQCRAERRAREWRRQEKAINAERRRHVPCAICGAPTQFWERHSLPDDLVICSLHSRRHYSALVPDSMPAELDALFIAARLALLSFEGLIKEVHQHG